MIERPFLQFPPDRTPRTWLGANFWSRVGGPLMWRVFNAEVVREELHILHMHGLNITRSFFYWPDFMPAPDTIDETYVARYRQFLDLCQEADIYTIPTFIVGHMSGENWDVPWRGGRDLYMDGWMLAQQAFFIREMTRRFKDHPSIAGWLISNEMPLYGGPTTPEAGRSWAQLMVQAVHAAGATQPVSLGEGAWGIEVTGRDNGFRLRDIAPTVDFIGPHCYFTANDVLRLHLSAAYNCELSHFGKPVILEEFGVSTDFASDKHAGDYYRQVLHTTLLAGSVGWIAWNNTDFDLAHQDPYRHHPFELHFGITHTNGSPKAPLLELEKFRQVLDSIDIAHCHRPASNTALLIPSSFDMVYPFAIEEERKIIHDILLQSYVVTKEADMSVACVRELDDIPQVPLILLPSTKQLVGPTWEALEARAYEGATVYVSFFSGHTGLHRGIWHSSLNKFFGIEHQLRYGLISPVNEDSIIWTLTQDIGDMRAGETLSFKVAGSEHGRAFLPLIPTEAHILATDQYGRPALIERRVGTGRILLSTYPLEYFATSHPYANPNDTYRLYRALGMLANIESPVTVDHPEILVDSLVHEDGTRFVWMMSEADHPLSITPTISGDRKLVPINTNETVSFPIEIPPFEVNVYRLKP